MALIESLESNDETIRRDTLDLLYRMTNAKNVTFIVQKMMEQKRHPQDAAFCDRRLGMDIADPKGLYERAGKEQSQVFAQINLSSHIWL